MTIEDTLLQRFGPLLSMAQLASVLDRSPDGLRVSLRTTSEWAATGEPGDHVHHVTDDLVSWLEGAPG